MVKQNTILYPIGILKSRLWRLRNWPLLSKVISYSMPLEGSMPTVTLLTKLCTRCLNQALVADRHFKEALSKASSRGTS